MGEQKYHGSEETLPLRSLDNSLETPYFHGVSWEIKDN